jgi:hypothetical protein
VENANLPRNGHISAIAAPKRIKVQPLTGVTDPPSWRAAQADKSLGSQQ